MIKFASRYPVIFSLLVILLSLAIGLLIPGANYSKHPHLAIIGKALTCGYVILLLTHLRWWRETGFKKPATWCKLLACLPLLLFPIGKILNGFEVGSVNQMIQLAIFLLMVGFAEEALFRGVVLRALTPSGLARAVVLSSLFFGLSHFSNLLGGATIPATIVQVIAAMLLGIGFAGARLYTGTIWPVIIVHALIDFTNTTNGQFVSSPIGSLTLRTMIVTSLIPALYALYGLWLLRRATVDTATVTVAK